jgi:hypothetical protein
MSNLPTPHRTQHPAVLARRERRQLQALESSATVELVATQLRQTLAQASILAETAVTQTAMVSVTSTAATAAALQKAVPGVAEALALLQAKHAINQAHRIDAFAAGR